MGRKTVEALDDADFQREGGATGRQVVGPKSKEEAPAPSKGDIAIMIARHDEIDAALAEAFVELDGERLSVADANKARDELRGKLKEAMGRQQLQRVVDEVSDKVARLSPSFSDEWNLSKLKTALKPAQRRLVIIEAINHAALAELIKAGAVSRAALEVAGAVGKKLRSVALLVRPIKEDPDE